MKQENTFSIIHKLSTVIRKIQYSLLEKLQIIFGGTITGIVMAYYYGFLFTIIVNSVIWYVISYLVNKYYYKSKRINDQKYLIKYSLSKIKSRNKRKKTF